MMGIPRDHKTPYTKTDKCHECDEKIKMGKAGYPLDSVKYLKVFDDPWATEACHVVLHDDNDEGNGTCLEKLFDTSCSDFRYFECEICHRVIIRQCPDNGWRSYVKERNGAEICIKCWQDDILEHGHSLESLDQGIPGEFFNHSDLNTFLWSLVSGCNNVHVLSISQSKEILQRAKNLIKQRYKVLFNINSMAYGGSEGYVSLYCKSISGIQARKAE
jgi:hypothetical protein